MKRVVLVLPAKIIGLALLAMICAAPVAFAQVLYGSIAGTLTDESGAVVPKAVVTVTNTSTGLSREATTTDDGYYTIPNLPEGTYDLSVSAGGFKPYTQKNINVPVNAVTRINATVQIGSLNEQVTVEAATAALQTTRSDVSVNLDTRAIENLPLSGYRNFQSLINLVPGATPGAIPERRYRHARTVADDERQRPGARRQQHPRRWFGRHPGDDAASTRHTCPRRKASSRSTSRPTTSMPSRG